MGCNKARGTSAPSQCALQRAGTSIRGGESPPPGAGAADKPGGDRSAIVLSVDEKTRIQALNRTHGRSRSGRCGRACGLVRLPT